MIYTDEMIKHKKNQKEKRHKILKVLFYPLTIAILLVVFYMGYLKFIKKENDINVLGFRQYMVVTGSMEDTIKVKDIVIVKITKDVKNNEIISYEDNNKIITHRIIKITDNYIVTKGDANNSEDKPITKEKVVGKVVCIIPKVAIWQKVFASPPVFISGSITIILLYLVYVNKDEEEKKGNICLDEKEKQTKSKL